MIKVEAVVIRERVETVIDAVEEQTGHVGVTVVEAIGHGRQRGITHEYRGRTFESRFLPKAVLTFVVAEEIAGGVVAAIADAARSGNESGDGIVWTTPVGNVTHNRTGLQARGGGARMTTEELTIAASTVWVVVAAVLVMFMQAGFAFLEAGLTRMKNAGHIAAKNVLVLGIASLVYYVVGFGIAFGDGGNGFVGGSGFAPSSEELLAIGAEPFSWFSSIPAGAAYFFQVVFAAVSLAIVWGAMAERTKLWVYFAFGVVFTLVYSVVSHWIWHPGRLALRDGDAGLRRLDGRPLPGSARRAGRCASARPADREVRLGRQAERHPGPQHGFRHARRPDPLVRLVRLQPGLDARRRHRRPGRLLRVRRADDERRGRRRRDRRRHRGVDRAAEARPFDDAERRDRGPRRRDGGGRLRGALGGDRHRPRRRRDRGAGRALCRADADRRPDRRRRGPRDGGVWGTLATGIFAVPALAENLATGKGGLWYTGSFDQLGTQALGLLAVGVFTFSASFGSLWAMKALWGIRVEPEVETAGLDVSEHGMWGYPEFYIPVPGGYGTESHGHLLGHAHHHSEPAVVPEAEPEAA